MLVRGRQIQICARILMNKTECWKMTLKLRDRNILKETIEAKPLEISGLSWKMQVMKSKKRNNECNLGWMSRQTKSLVLKTNERVSK